MKRTGFLERGWGPDMVKVQHNHKLLAFKISGKKNVFYWCRMLSVCLWQYSVRYLNPVEYAAPIEPSYEISKNRDKTKKTEVKKSNKKKD